ncbi:MAG TPA: ABC transporter ATP-binding protein [Chlamydiales bacterium]|nr:ABC transporter ATP-binding protein [Chlamydiales bacterium]
MNSFFEIKNLTVSYLQKRREVEALRNFNLSLSKGEIVGIVGESGSGKSTSMDAIMGLLPQSARIKSGEVYLEGEEISSKICKIRGKKISMIFQDPTKSLNPVMRIGKQIEEGFATPKPKQRVLDLLRKVGITDPETRYDQYPYELSGGMCQRVFIAIALAASPKILIADEPTTALDATIQEQILSLLKEIQVQEKMSMIIISHDLNVIKSICHRMLVLYAGQIVEEGRVQEVLQNPLHPYTQALLEATPSFALKNNRKLKAIHGSPPSLSPPPIGCPFHERCPYAVKICSSPPPLITTQNLQKYSCWKSKT